MAGGRMKIKKKQHTLWKRRGFLSSVCRTAAWKPSRIR